MHASQPTHPSEDRPALRLVAEVFTDAGTPIQVDAGQVLFHEGDATTSAYYLRKGAVRLSIYTANWHELVLANLGAGAVFGEVAALDGQPRTATATAKRASELFVLPAARLEHELRTNAELATYLLRSLTTGVRRADRQLASQSGQAMLGRVAAALLELCDHADAANSCVVSITQQELAAWVGSTRESTARCLARLRDAGCITTARGRIHITDHAALHAASN